MHNLTPYSGDAFSLYEDAVDRKDDGDSKKGLLAAKTTIKSYYKEFDKNFPNGTLRTIPPRRIDSKTPLWKDLYDMYGFDSAIVGKIKDWLKKNNPVTVYPICQYCGLTLFDTMDHILPHKQYVEYSVHARNLIPCCSACNRSKNEDEVLDLYHDILPNVEYLYMNVEANGDTISCSFHLDNSHGMVEATLFSKISQHYKRLDLLSKMASKAESEVARFVWQINGQYKKEGKSAVISSVMEEVDGMRGAYGYNYWDAAFKKGLVNSSVFWDYYTKGLLV